MSNSSNPADHAFANLTHLQVLVITETQHISTQRQLSTEDLYGLSHLTNLQSLTVKMLNPMQSDTGKYMREVPTISPDKLKDLPRLTALHLKEAPEILTMLSNLQALTHQEHEDISDNFAAMQRLTRLFIGPRFRLKSEDIVILARLPELKHLTYASAVSHAYHEPQATIHPRPWRHLTALRSLQQLDLLGIDYDDAGLFIHLSKLSQLIGLSLSFHMHIAILAGMSMEESVCNVLRHLFSHLSMSDPQLQRLTSSLYKTSAPGLVPTQIPIGHDVLDMYRHRMPGTKVDTVECNSDSDFDAFYPLQRCN